MERQFCRLISGFDGDQLEFRFRHAPQQKVVIPLQPKKKNYI